MTETRGDCRGALLAGRYRVLRRLGTGGMATVFLAEDEQLGRKVAIKRLHTDAPGPACGASSSEARLGAALNHPNFVAVYDTVATDEGALIVMEYVRGILAGGAGRRPEAAARAGAADPRAASPRRSTTPTPRASSTATSSRATSSCGDDGTVKLADLGIARAIGATQITSEGSVVGTLPYMSPERLQGPAPADPRATSTRSRPSPTSCSRAAPERGDLDRGGRRAGAARPARATGPRRRPPPWPRVLERGLDPEPGRRQPVGRAAGRRSRASPCEGRAPSGRCAAADRRRRGHDARGARYAPRRRRTDLGRGARVLGRGARDRRWSPRRCSRSRRSRSAGTEGRPG